MTLTSTSLKRTKRTHPHPVRKMKMRIKNQKIREMSQRVIQMQTLGLMTAITRMVELMPLMN